MTHETLASPAAVAAMTTGLLALTACAEPAPQWAGEWEGFVETSRQAVLMVVQLEELLPEGEARTSRDTIGTESPSLTGEVDIFGNRLPLEELGVHGDSIRFAVQLGPQRISFAGLRSGDEVSGEAVLKLELAWC